MVRGAFVYSMLLATEQSKSYFRDEMKKFKGLIVKASKRGPAMSIQVWIPEVWPELRRTLALEHLCEVATKASISKQPPLLTLSGSPISH